MNCDKGLFIVLLGEVIGTAVLMFIGCMSCVLPLVRNGLLEVSIAFGLAVTAAIQCMGCVSGAHINPVVTLANCLLGLMPWDIAISYTIAQIVGALAGYALLMLVIASDQRSGLCLTMPTGISDNQAIGVEFLITLALVLFCCAVWTDAGKLDTISLRFGMWIVVLIIAGGKQTGASLNFARTLAPAIWHEQYHKIWIYLVAQAGAGIVGALSWRYVFAAGGGGGGGGVTAEA